MASTFTIVTACMGRLDHLKLTLPRMVAQQCEVIVVDFSCPQQSGAYVEKNFPTVRIVRVPGASTFSNWRARNAGSRVASSDVLLFVDADTLLAEAAVERLAETLPENAYGFFSRKTSRTFNSGEARLASNQLLGFQAIPANAFREIGGYDEVLEGYASGADTDLEDRLRMTKIAGYELDPSIIDRVIDHDVASRLKYHSQSIRSSYAAGLLYRSMKYAMLKLRGEREMPLAMRRKLYAAAQKASSRLEPGESRSSMRVVLDRQPVLMPRQLGFERGTQTLSLQIEISLEDEIESSQHDL